MSSGVPPKRDDSEAGGEPGLRGLQALAARPTRAPRRARRSLGGRLGRRVARLREAHATLAAREEDAAAAPGAEWLLDNFYIVERAIRVVREEFPRGFEARLPVLTDPPDEAMPLVLALVREIARNARHHVEIEDLRERVLEFQQWRALSLAELWALPTLLRYVLLAALADAAASIADLAVDAGPDDDDPSEVVANCVRSLRALETANWKDFVEAASVTDSLLRRDPAGAYARMDFESRNRYRRAVEELSRWSGADEPAVAEAALHLARTATEGREAHVGCPLVAEGRPALEAALGALVPRGERFRRALRRHATPVYLGSIAALSLVPVAALAAACALLDAGVAASAAACLLALGPASATAVGVVNALVTRILPPAFLPKLDLTAGIPAESRTLVAVPVIVSDEPEIDELLEMLAIRYLGNGDPALAFALVADLPDAAAATLPGDAPLLRRMEDGVRALNARLGQGAAPFHLFHRPRTWCPAEDRWMGWDRKRGKLEELHRWLAGGAAASALLHVGDAEALAGVRYVIVLDGDTELPPGTAQRLVGALAHPLQHARFDADGRVTAGYTVLQPRIEVHPGVFEWAPLPRLFGAGEALDPYVHAVSDAYQDLFGVGVFIGKGIYAIEGFDRSLAGRVPEGALLSHDLFEGLHGRVGLVTDVVLMEQFPSQYLAYARRRHRWIRGDWQLLPWLRRRVPLADGSRGPSRFAAIGRWMIADNLRRSLVAPALLGLLLVALLRLPGSPLVWACVALLAPLAPTLVDVASTVIARVATTSRHPVLASLFRVLRRSLGLWALQLVFLPHDAWLALDAVARTLWRLRTRHRLLEWTPAAQEHRHVSGQPGRALVWRETLAGPATGLAALGLALVWRPEALAALAPLALAWVLSPELAHRISRPRERRALPLDPAGRRELRRLARRTWRFFETFVGPEDQWLPPDHFQEQPRGVVARRTSPTNIGLLQLATAAAYDLGYIGPVDAGIRLRNTLDTLDRLERHRGHFLNWYDTRSLVPLEPRYVSTVDSGNLAASLVVTAQCCLEWTHAPVLGAQRWDGAVDTLDALDQALARLAAGLPPAERARVGVLEAELRDLEQAIAALRPRPSAWRAAVDELEVRTAGFDRRLVELLTSLPATPDPLALAELRAWAGRFRLQLDAMRRDADLFLPWLRALDHAPLALAEEAPRATREAWEALRAALPADVSLFAVPALADAARKQLETLAASAAAALQGADADAVEAFLNELAGELEAARQRAEERVRELEAMAERARRLVAEMDFKFLYDRHRHLLHLGFHVGNGTLDGNHYDLLASEARIASFLAIAKGDVPPDHWIHLGRSLGRVGGARVLLSWSGTMFEYLMPPLVMREGRRTLIGRSCRAAVRAQIAYARRKRLPWGMSESGYFEFDEARSYQYRAFGVPALGFKRGLEDDLVIAPYASVLALRFAPRAVVANLRRLERLGAMGPHGFYEAVDFTPARSEGAEGGAIVRSYMAHHQGMILAALDGALCDDALVRRFHADPLVRVAELLPFEREPVGVPIEEPHPEAPLLVAPRRPRVELASWVADDRLRVPAVHVLANQRYAVIAAERGGAASLWQGMALTRWHPDAAGDDGGARVFLADREGPLRVSSAGHGSTGLRHETHFHPHLVDQHVRGDGIAVRLRTAVAPDADVEVRELVVSNDGPAARRLLAASYAEIVLGDALADARHPAFSKLFLEAEVLDAGTTIVLRRRPRGAREPAAWLVHRLVLPREGATAAGWETSRERFLGRGRTVRRPAALEPGGPALRRGEAGPAAPLDPVAVLGAELALEPGERVAVGWLTAVAETRDGALAAAERFGTLGSIEWVFEYAATRTEGELARQGLDAEKQRAFWTLLSYVLQPHPALRAGASLLRANQSGPSALWRHGISGDHPIVLVRVRDPEETELVAEVVRAQGAFRRAGVRVDIVVLSEAPEGYLAALEDRLARALASAGFRAILGSAAGIFLVHADRVGEIERIALFAAARVVLDAAAGPLAAQLQLPPAPTSLPPLVPTGAPAVSTPFVPRPDWLLFDNGIGGFEPDGSAYVLHLEPGAAAPAPWSNVIANRRVGFLVTETGGGFTWAENSAENRLTTWLNDPVSDEPAEAIYLRDEETGAVWSPTPAPAPAAAPYEVRHAPGVTTFRHASHGLEQRLELFVAVDDPVKIARLRLENLLDRPRRITATWYLEWVLGTLRSLHSPYVVPEFDAEHEVLLVQNPWNEAYAERVGFAAASRPLHGLTGDRLEFLGRRGTLAAPAALGRIGLGRAVRPGLDPCAALQVHVDLGPGEAREVHFLLGQAASRAEALAVVERHREAAAAEAALAQVRAHFEEWLSAVQVKTPDPGIDLMLNTWLPYQTLVCRMMARSGYYQSSGAFGFRDQLQDGMALAATAPAVTRAHLLEATRHQFPEGDVLHWWHPPLDAGVRTRCSDDMLWLPFATAHYVATTGDAAVLDEQVPFLAGAPLGAAEEDRYDRWRASAESASLYEHCLRALARGDTAGAHGLPLFGGGDWNDGMNRVGEGGRGESVWLAWFLISVLRAFAPLAEARGERAQAEAFRRRADEIAGRVEATAWDGAWYLRGWYDDGTALGSSASRECRIDAIAQAWAVLSGAGEPARAEQAVRSAVERLVRSDEGLVLLLTPPFDRSVEDPGYIRAYPPGVRENGGQYTHGAVWLLWALARLGDGDRAAALFRRLLPLRHARDRAAAERYRLEPYALAADVYGAPPHVGRGGWSWYTGAAGWTWRFGLEALLGLRREAGGWRLDPCIPRAWPGFEIELREGQTRWRIEVTNPRGVGRGVAQVRIDGVEVAEAFVPCVEDDRTHRVQIVLGAAVPPTGS